MTQEKLEATQEQLTRATHYLAEATMKIQVTEDQLLDTRLQLKETTFKLQQTESTIQSQQATIKALNETIQSQQATIQELHTTAKSKQHEIDNTKRLLMVNCKIQSVHKPQSFMERVLYDPFLCQKIIGLNKTDFFSLFERCKPKFMCTNMRGSQRKNSAHMPLTVSNETQLFICLFWLRMYPIMAVMQVLFGLHFFSISRILKRVLLVLEASLASEIAWPSDEEMLRHREEFKSYHPPGFERVVCAVDGSEFRVKRPVDNKLQYKLYSAKKKQHSLNVLFVCLLNGVIIFVSTPQQVSNDQGHWNSTNLRARFEGKDYGIVGDGGFYFNRVKDEKKIYGYAPHKKKNKQPLTQDQKTFNTHLSKIRVVIENVIDKVKKWRVFKMVFRHYDPTGYRKDQIPFGRIINVVSCLTNIKLKSAPLRSPDWKPTLE